MEISSGENVNSGSLNPTPAEQMWFADKTQLHFNNYINKQNKHFGHNKIWLQQEKHFLVSHTSAAASQAW